MNTRNFAALLKQKRTTLHFSQRKVAELCFLSRSAYNLIEHGIRCPNLETLIRLSLVLNTDASEFLNALTADVTPDSIANQDTSMVVKEDSPTDSFYTHSVARSFAMLKENQQQAVNDIIDSFILINNNADHY